MTMPKSSPQVSYADHVPLIGLASRWGQEIGQPRDVLARGIISAFANSEFDGLIISEPLVLIDPDNLRIDPVSRDGAKTLLTPYVTLDGRPLEFRYLAVLAGWLHVHPGVVSAFAVRRGLPMPSWLQAVPAVDTIKPTEKNVPVAELLAFLKTLQKRTRKDEMISLAKAHFAPRTIPARLFERACKDLPDEMKRARGETERTIALRG